MAKFIIDITNSHPELKDTWKLFEELAYRRAYSQVFSDLIERMLSRQMVNFEKEELVSKPFTPSDYSKTELTALDNIILALEEEYKKRVWFRKEKDDRRPSGWYEPLGDLGDKKFVTMAEPACGSGRFGLAAGTYIGSKGVPSYICQNDLDSICAKMTAINMTYNGIVGEVTCANGLDIEGNTFRFGYKICPILSFFDPEHWNSIRFEMYRTTRKWAEFQYVALPVTYEQTYMSKVNAKTLELIKKRTIAAKEEKKTVAIQELKAQVQENLKGTLFETDTSQLDNIRLGKPQQKTKKPSSKKLKIDQPKLF